MYAIDLPQLPSAFLVQTMKFFCDSQFQMHGIHRKELTDSRLFSM